MVVDAMSVAPPQTFPTAPIITSLAGPARPGAGRLRSQSVSVFTTERSSRPAQFHAKQSTSPFFHRLRVKECAALSIPPLHGRRNSHSAGTSIASPRTSHGQGELLKWDVSAWNEHVAQHRPKRARLGGAHDFDSSCSVIDDNATDHVPCIDTRLSLAIQDPSRIELMAMHYPDSSVGPRVVPSASSTCAPSAPLESSILPPSPNRRDEDLASSPLQWSPQIPLLASDQLHNPPTRFTQTSSTTGGPRAPPPSEDSSSCADDDACRIVMDEGEQAICMSPGEPGPGIQDGRNHFRSLGRYSRKHRASSMNAMLDLAGIDMAKAFARLTFLGSPSRSPRRHNIDDMDVEEERGRPLTRKRPLEHDGDEHGQKDSSQLYSKGHLNDALSRSATTDMWSRPVIPLRRSMSRASPSFSSRSPPSAISPHGPSSFSPLPTALHCGYQPDYAFTVPPSIKEVGEHPFFSALRRTSDSAVQPHHSRLLVRTESSILGANVPQLGDDHEMNISDTEDTVLSPLSSPTYTASTVERDSGEHYQHPTQLEIAQHCS